MEKKKTTIEIISYSPEQTFELGNTIGRSLKDGDILALSGELGTGKTCFAGGLARGLGVDENYQITSPTFTLINEYPARCKLYHFDVYRLGNYSELDDLGYEEYISGNGVVVIEWAEKIAEVLPAKAVFFKFEYLDEHSRKIIITGFKPKLKEFKIDI
jgi:tRNA threonylcarbamoyladenosine biosynthesis protein TsaE